MALRASEASTAKGSDIDHDPLMEMLEECFGIQTTRQELDSPTSGFIVSVLHGALRTFGLNEDILALPHCLLPTEATHIENTVTLCNYVKLMQEIFRPLGVPDIGLQDLANPKPKRTRKLLKILVNSWLRMSGIYTKYKEKESKQLEAKNIARETKTMISTKTIEVNKLAGLLGEVAQKAENIDKERSACDKALATSVKKKAAIVSDYQQLKSACYASTEAIQRAELDIMELKESLEERRASVCRDPATRKERIAADTETLTALESAIVDFRGKLSVIEAKVKLVPQISDAFQKFRTATHECEAKVARIKELREIKAAQEKKRIEVEHTKHTLQKKLELMGEEEVHFGRKTGGQPHTLDLESREQRNKDAQARYQELVELHKAASTAENAKQAELEAAALRIEEEIDSLQKKSQEYIAENEKKMRVELDKLQAVVTLVQDTWNPERLRSLSASCYDDLHKSNAAAGNT